jgi:nucleoside-diphosphate-sugar epimerase
LVRVGAGENKIDAVYVENAARAHLLAADRLHAESPVAGRAYFITNGEPVNCWQWIDQLLALAGVPHVRRSISFGTAWHLGRMLETVWRVTGQRSEPRMTRFLAAQLAVSHYFDISAARRDLNYHPSISMAEGMKRLGEWLSSQPAAPAS